MVDRETDYGLEFLLAFDGRIHHLEKGYWIKFRDQACQSDEGAASRSLLFIDAAWTRRHATGGLRQCPRCPRHRVEVQAISSGE